MIYDKKRICSAPKIKTHSHIEILKGKKILRALPEHFFENILELDLKLKINFTPQVFDQLINMLKIAIDYYENIGDPKYKDYQFLIEDLLTQPTVLKHLNKESSEKVIKKHPLSKKVKLDKNTQNNTKNILLISDENYLTVKGILKDAVKTVPENNILIDDLQKQEDDFQKKLKEKRSKRIQSGEIKYDNNDDAPDLQLKENSSSSNFFVTENSNSNMDGNSVFINKAENSENSSANVTLNTLSNYETVSNFKKGHRKHLSMFVLSDKVHEELNIKKTSKKSVVEGVKDKINVFLSEFNDYFDKNISQKYSNHIEMLMEKKYKKYLEINEYHQAQIKEMELLLTSTESNDNQHLDSIKEIINELKRSQRIEIEKNEKNNQLLLKESSAKFQQLGFKNNKSIDSIEKNFKVEIYMFIDSILKSA